MFKYLTEGMRLAALFIGAVVFGAAYALFWAIGWEPIYAWAMITACGSAILVALTMSYMGWRRLAVFYNAQSRVSGDIRFCDRVLVVSGNLRRTAFLFLTKDSLYLYLWDKRPYLETKAEKTQMTVIPQGEQELVTLKFSDRDTIYLRTPHANELVLEMRELEYPMAYLGDGGNSHV